MAAEISNQIKACPSTDHSCSAIVPGAIALLQKEERLAKLESLSQGGHIVKVSDTDSFMAWKTSDERYILEYKRFVKGETNESDTGESLSAIYDKSGEQVGDSRRTSWSMYEERDSKVENPNALKDINYRVLDALLQATEIK